MAAPSHATRRHSSRISRLRSVQQRTSAWWMRSKARSPNGSAAPSAASTPERSPMPSRSARARDAQARQRDVRDDDLAAAERGEKKRRPARAAADLEQTLAGPEAQATHRPFRLRTRGPTRCPIGAAAHALLDLQHQRRLPDVVVPRKVALRAGAAPRRLACHRDTRPIAQGIIRVFALRAMLRTPGSRSGATLRKPQCQSAATGLPSASDAPESH
jgi:hypothetical protein